MKKSNLIKNVLLVLSFACLIFCLSACSDKRGVNGAETYYDINVGIIVTFDGKGSCDYGGMIYKYEIKNGYYYIYGDNTILLKQPKDGVLALANSYGYTFETSARSGPLNESIYIGPSGSITLSDDGTFIGSDGYSTVIAIGNYYYNDGVLMFEQTAGIDANGGWSTAVKYFTLYVEEVTGRLADVLLKDPDYYKSWHFDSENEDPSGGPETPSSAKHSLTYDLNYDGLTIISSPVAKNDYVELLVPKRDGYVFDGWYYEWYQVESGVWQYDTDVTLTAHWREMTYTITYNANGGDLPENKMTSFSILSNDLPYALPIPTKEGCNFEGWYEDENFLSGKITEIPKGSLRNYVLYAKYTDEELLEFELSDDEEYYTVVGFKGYPQYISVPATKDGMSVKEIAARAFENCNSLISVALPDGIVKIGESAFDHCYNLTSINFPDGLTTIGSSAFSYCYKLRTVDFPKSVTSIGSAAFSDCDSLTVVDLPENLTVISAGTFGYCYNLIAVDFPDGLTAIEYGAFCSCSKLASVNFPDGLTSIGERAFECDNLTTVTLPDSIMRVGNNAFDDRLCTRYANCYYLPTKSSAYGVLCKSVSNDIVSVKIHEGCKVLGDWAFNSCHSLTSLSLPDGLISIGEYSLCYLTTIIIPASLTKMYSYSGSDVIFYKGNADSWDRIEGRPDYLAGKLYYFSADEPADDGNYWHYAQDGTTPEIWQKEVIGAASTEYAIG